VIVCPELRTILYFLPGIRLIMCVSFDWGQRPQTVNIRLDWLEQANPMLLPPIF